MVGDLPRIGQFLFVYYVLLNSFLLIGNIIQRPYVWILVTLTCLMSVLFANNTPRFMEALRFFLVAFLLIVFREMLLEFAAGRGLLVFTTTPPHCVAPFTAMGTARPVVVLFFVVLFIAVLTQFLVEINVAPLS